MFGFLARLFGRRSSPTQTPASASSSTPAATLAPRSLTTDPAVLSGLTASLAPGDHGHTRLTVTAQPGQPLARFRWRIGGQFTYWSGAEGFAMEHNPSTYGLPNADYVLEREIAPGQWAEFARG